MTESKKGTLEKTYHLKSSQLDHISKLILASDSNGLERLNITDVQIGLASVYFSSLETASFEVVLLDTLISKGQEYSDSDVEFKVRHSLLKVAAELDKSSIGGLLPLFKSFDLKSDESYLIKTEQVKNAVEKVFLEFLIIKKQTYDQAQIEYLSEHTHCKFYPIKPDGITGVTIDNFWPEKPEEAIKKSAPNKAKEVPWTFKRLIKLTLRVACFYFIFPYLWNLDFGVLLWIFYPVIFGLIMIITESIFEENSDNVWGG